MGESNTERGYVVPDVKESLARARALGQSTNTDGQSKVIHTKDWF